MCARWPALLVLIATAAPVEAQVVVTFQQGAGSYAGYQDSQIRETMPTTVPGTAGAKPLESTPAEPARAAG